MGQNVFGLRPNKVFSRGQAFERKQQVVLVGGEPEAVFNGDDVSFDEVLNDRVKILHAFKLSVAHGIQQGFAFRFTVFDVFTGASGRPQNLYRGHASATITPRNQPLRNDVAKSLRESRANYRLFVLR